MNLYSQSKLAAYRSVKAHGMAATADPHSMVLMLFDAALGRLAAAGSCIERGDAARKASLLHSVVILLAELRGSLNLQQGGSLAQNLSDLYEYMARRWCTPTSTTTRPPSKRSRDFSRRSAMPGPRSARKSGGRPPAPSPRREAPARSHQFSTPAARSASPA